MKIIVGLGNPGARYVKTRHNVGFDVIEELGRRCQAPLPRLKFEAELAEGTIGNEKVLLVAPQTFMNLSGKAVQPLVKFYQVAVEDVLVICDDLNLPFAQLRLRAGGSGGGQKGLQHIVQLLGTDQVPRLRLGIDRPPAPMDAAAYVLAKFSKQESLLMDEAIQRAADAVGVWVKEGLDAAMNRYNVGVGKPPGGGSKTQSA